MHLAELRTVDIDPVTLDIEFKNLLNHQPKFNWHQRSYVNMHFFTSYFKNLVDNILDAINLPYYDILFQTHHEGLYEEKEYLLVTHRDTYRNCCITIPIYVNDEETVNFYGPIETDIHPVTETTNLNKPIISSGYSKKHPSLVNTNIRHNVRILDNSPRILLQISYKQYFEDVICANPKIWHLYA